MDVRVRMSPSEQLHGQINNACDLSATIAPKMHWTATDCKPYIFCLWSSHHFAPVRLWGLTAIYAYRAYRKDSYLQIATFVWNHAQHYWISPEIIQDGANLPHRDFQNKCKGGPLPDIQSSNILSSIVWGQCLSLAAYFGFVVSPVVMHEHQAETRKDGI